MLFVSKYTIRPEHRDAAIRRFLETAAPAPKGVKLLARYHDVGARAGYSIAETDDPTLMAQFALDWSDLLTIETHPVITDEQFAKLIAKK
ncbi:MAG: DUF3303 family protein [Myxococcales bacterium]|jgi:hypothetical protein